MVKNFSCKSMVDSDVYHLPKLGRALGKNFIEITGRTKFFHPHNDFLVMKK